ncbi:MAG: PsiF family protein [Xanthobacteraceae bacterium]
MRMVLRVLVICLITTAPSHLAWSQQPSGTCKANAAEKKLAGAALKSFMTKCERDATTACDADSKEKKLAGAARTSHMKKCVTDAVGS